MITLRSILDETVSPLQIAPICQAVQSDSFLDELAFSNGISMDALFEMQDDQLLALAKNASFNKLRPLRFTGDESLPRGADTLCLTCWEHGACRDWALDASEEICADHPSWNKEAVIEFIAANVLSGDYDHNTSIVQIYNEFEALR